MSAPVVCEPLTALVPDHAPLAEHAVTLLADQVSVAALPALMVLGVALKVTTGASPATVTVADCEAVPPGPVQVSAYSVVLVSIPVDHVPLVATPPLQPPEAVHAVTFPALQLKTDVPPLATVVGDAVNVTEGAAFTTTSADCEPEPPGPLQVNVKLVVAVSGSVAALPLVGRAPLHPPEAAQLCAFCALHCKVVAVPKTTLLLVGTNVTAGIAAPLPTESVGVVTMDAGAPQAASADNAAHTSAQRNICDAWQARHTWEWLPH